MYIWNVLILIIIFVVIILVNYVNLKLVLKYKELGNIEDYTTDTLRKMRIFRTNNLLWIIIVLVIFYPFMDEIFNGLLHGDFTEKILYSSILILISSVILYSILSYFRLGYIFKFVQDNREKKEKAGI